MPGRFAYHPLVSEVTQLLVDDWQQLFRSAVVFLTGSFRNGAVAMAAAMATLDVLEREDGIGSMQRQGAALVEGLDAAARRHGLRVTCSGPPSMPFMTFSDETNLYRSQRFVVECLSRGLFVHPYHNWFLSAAHRSEDIEAALRIADSAFRSVAEAFTELPEEAREAVASDAAR